MIEQIRKIYELVSELEELYPGRHFTPDGHMVGSIGEVAAAEKYGLELFVASHPVHDAKAPDGRLVQIKATQGDRVVLSECPKHLIVLKLFQDGSFEEVFNGPGDVAWGLCGKRQKTGQRQVSIVKLRKAMERVAPIDRLPAIGEE